MDHDGLARFRGKIELPFEEFALLRPRGEMVMIIEADLADSQYLRVAGEFAQTVEGFVGGFGCVVRVHAHGCINEGIAFR